MPFEKFEHFTNSTDHVPLCLTHWEKAIIMVTKTKAAEAAVLHHDRCTLCSSASAAQTSNSFITEFFFPAVIYYITSPQKQKNLILTYWCNSDVYFGLNDVSALQTWKGACICSRVFLPVWLVKHKRSISQQKQVLVQFSLFLPQVKSVSGPAVVSHDNCGLTRWGEGPGEGEILETVRTDARDGQLMSLFLCYMF